MRSVRSSLLFPSALALLSLLLPHSVAAQATVEGVVWDGVRSIPLEGARVAIPELERVTLSDDRGVFFLDDVPVGTYELTLEHEWLEALGVDPAPIPVTVAEADSVVRKDLVLPPLATLLATRCRGSDQAETMTLAGFVRDPVADISVPGARVRVEVMDGEEGGGAFELEAVSGMDGLYVMCGLPVGRPVEIAASLGGRSSETLATSFMAPGAVQLDLCLPVSAETATVRPGSLDRQRGQGDWVYGTLHDRETGEPVQAAEVTLAGSDAWRAVSDHEGRFRLPEVPPGGHTLVVDRLGYGTTEAEVVVEAGVPTSVEVALSVDPVEVDAIEVSVRRATVEEVAVHRVGTPSRALAREDIRRAVSATHAGQLARNLPGVYVREVRERGVPRICVESTRGPVGFRGGGCRQMRVYIDGNLAEPASDALMSLPPAQIESIEVFTPATAAATGFPMTGSSTEFLVIYTRGNGPYARLGREK